MVLHCSNSSVYKFESRQSHKARFSTLRSRSFVLVFKLFAVLFKSCSALCMNSKAWQSTQGRLSAGITVPASALASVRKPVVAVTAATSRRSRVREGAANMAARGRERGRERERRQRSAPTAATCVCVGGNVTFTAATVKLEPAPNDLN